MSQEKCKLSTSIFFTGANKQLKNTSKTLLLSEIYTRGNTYPCIQLDVKYVSVVLGISDKTLARYLTDFKELNFLDYEKSRFGYNIIPNIENIEKYILEGDKQLIKELNDESIRYNIVGFKEPLKTGRPKKSQQRTLFNIRKKSRIENKWLNQNVEVKTYKNLVLKGTTFEGKDKLYYSLSKLDKAILTGKYNDLTPTDFTRFYMTIYEEVYNMKYPTSFRDVQKMKVFLDTTEYPKSELVELFGTVMDRYRKLGYSEDNKNFPTMTIGMLKTGWLMDNLLNNIPKGSPKQDGVYRFEEQEYGPDTIVDEEF